MGMKRRCEDGEHGRGDRMSTNNLMENEKDDPKEVLNRAENVLFNYLRAG